MFRQSHAFLIVTLVTSTAYAQNGSTSIRVDGASREKLKNELVLRLTRDNSFRLVRETSFQIVFDKDASIPADRPLYQTSSPVDRYSFTIADIYDQGAQVAIGVSRVENSGTPVERYTLLQSGREVQEARDIVTSISRDWRTAVHSRVQSKSPPPMSNTSVYFRRSIPGLALARKPNVSVASRLGISARASAVDQTQGIEITSVDPRSVAAKAGLKPSDMIVGIDGQPIATGAQMEAGRALLLNNKQGKVEIIRNGKSFVAMLKF